MNSQYVTEKRIQIIRDVITSEETIEIDDSLLHKGPKGTKSTYYLGWKGALESIGAKTKETIPKNVHFDVVDSEQGNIMIKLTNEQNEEGYSAYTKSIVDQSNHQIVKSTIVIYDVENISDEQLATALRHELGHAFGLGHSTAPEDFMAPLIITLYPYISQCDIDAIRELYNGNQNNEVLCEK